MDDIDGQITLEVLINQDNELVWAGLLEHDIPYVEYCVDLRPSTSCWLRHLHLPGDRHDRLTVGVVEIDSKVARLTVLSKFSNKLDDQVHRRMPSGELRRAYFIENAHYIQFLIGGDIGTVR